MYARVTRISGARVDEEQVGPMTERIVNEARALEGIRGGYWLRSADSGDLLAVTLWDTEEAMAATERQAASLREEMSQEAGGQVTVDRCEVIGQI
jgi:heme-degrading monooxygenase HmoA